MWVISVGTPRSAGLYTPDDGEPFELMKGALKPDQAVAVTVEPAGGSKQPTSDPVVTIPIA
jgi:anti-sigma-K factor RskA